MRRAFDHATRFRVAVVLGVRIDSGRYILHNKTLSVPSVFVELIQNCSVQKHLIHRHFDLIVGGSLLRSPLVMTPDALSLLSIFNIYLIIHIKDTKWRVDAVKFAVSGAGHQGGGRSAAADRPELQTRASYGGGLPPPAPCLPEDSVSSEWSVRF